MAKKVAQIIEEQVQFWTLKNASKIHSGPPSKKLPIITISREFGASGAALAKISGEKLGFKVWDKELFDIISEKLGGNPEYLQSLDENIHSLVEDTLFGFMNHKGTNLNYLLYLVKAIRAIELQGNSIVVGRGANFICTNKRSFHVRIVAPLEQRVLWYANKEGITKHDALKFVTQKDKERAKFIAQNFNRDVEVSSSYDILLNSSVFPLDTLAEIVSTAYTCKITDPQPQPIEH